MEVKLGAENLTQEEKTLINKEMEEMNNLSFHNSQLPYFHYMYYQDQAAVEKIITLVCMMCIIYTIIINISITYGSILYLLSHRHESIN